jgi:alanine racemase
MNILHHTYSNWVEISLGAISHNVNLIKETSGQMVMAIVKANGYGHGAVQVAQAAVNGGVHSFGVARMEEAMELRQAGISLPVLILGYTPREKYLEALINHVSMAVWDQEQIEQIACIARQIGITAHLHLKIDTGMSRLGVQPGEALPLSHSLANTPGIIYEGVFTHFAKADEDDQTVSDIQEQEFNQVLDHLRSHNLLPPIVHAANSAAVLKRPNACFTAVRTGIIMYGLNPSKTCQVGNGFRSALQWKSVLSQVKTLPPGRGVSYGHEYVTTEYERIGTIPVGYADGYRRLRGNHVLVNGHLVPVVGRVCMDQIMVQLDEAPNAKEGDEVILIGDQEGSTLSADDVADYWGTVNYEVICAIGPRVPRVYLP